jgi:hypothetical protein
MKVLLIVSTVTIVVLLGWMRWPEDETLPHPDDQFKIPTFETSWAESNAAPTTAPDSSSALVEIPDPSPEAIARMMEQDKRNRAEHTIDFGGVPFNFDDYFGLMHNEDGSLKRKASERDIILKAFDVPLQSDEEIRRDEEARPLNPNP